MNEQRAIASRLMEIDAVSLSADPPFTWASGRKSPIYCDNRLLMSSPEARRDVARAFAALIEKNDWRPDVIAGTATAGIPHAAWLAEILDLPMIYVRGAAKQHGKGNQIEGRLVAGQKVLLVEDLISTGGSSVAAAQAVVEAGGDLIAVAAIFTYGLAKADAVFQEAGIAFQTLTSFPILLEEALSQGHLTAEQKDILAGWQRDPAAWSVERGGAG